MMGTNLLVARTRKIANTANVATQPTPNAMGRLRGETVGGKCGPSAGRDAGAEALLGGAGTCRQKSPLKRPGPQPQHKYFSILAKYKKMRFEAKLLPTRL